MCFFIAAKYANENINKDIQLCITKYSLFIARAAGVPLPPVTIIQIYYFSKYNIYNWQIYLQQVSIDVLSKCLKGFENICDHNSRLKVLQCTGNEFMTILTSPSRWFAETEVGGIMAELGAAQVALIKQLYVINFLFLSQKCIMKLLEATKNIL